VIEEFMHEFRMEQEKWSTLAQRVHAKCNQLLEQNNIRAICTWRCKEEKSLREKVIKISGERRKPKFVSGKEQPPEGPYRKVNDIHNDLVDLAGVRIALYFPNQSRDVDEMIMSFFQIIEKREHTGSKQSNTGMANLISKKPKFTGYIAQHYIVSVKHRFEMFGLLAEDLPSALPCVEIQVTSLILHVYYEIEHDIAYKRGGTKPSLHQTEVLDALNGLVKTGEALIENVYKSGTAILHERKPQDSFKNAYELEVFLSSKNFLYEAPLYGSSVKVLLHFLQRLEMSSPNNLTPILKSVDNLSTSTPCADIMRCGFGIDASINIMLAILQTRFADLDDSTEGRVERAITKKIFGEMCFQEEQFALEAYLRSTFPLHQSQSRRNIILSSIIWIAELFSSQESFKTFWSSLEAESIRSVEYPERGFAGLRWAILRLPKLEMNQPCTLPRDVDRQRLNSLWDWFVDQLDSATPILKFVFGISVLQVSINFEDHPSELSGIQKIRRKMSRTTL